MRYVSEFMGDDHDRLDAIFADFQEEQDSLKAKELFSLFDAGLRAHIGWEEDILFPAFEEMTGMRDTGPTAVMRMEHRHIKQLLDSIGQAVDQGAAAESSGELVEALTAHNYKEENMLYPLLDQSLEAEEASSLLERIKELQINT